MEFFVIINDEQQGPFTLEQLSRMDITPETEVWTEGMADWQQAGDVAALTTLLQQKAFDRHTTVPPMPPRHRPQHPQPAPLPEQRHYAEPVEQPKPQRKRGGCLLWGSLVLIVLVAAMAITTPSRQDHISAIKDVTREWVDDQLDQMGLGGIFLGEMSKWLGGSGVDLMLDRVFVYDNYIVCSMGRLKYGDFNKRVSFGIFGHVFTFSKDDINDGIKQELQQNVSVEPRVVVPPAEPEPEPAPEAQPSDESDTVVAPSNPAQELIDTLAARAKREAKRAAKEWVKKKIDEL
ncbi:MAG: DUF4339 domain-containing protein [Muribaculaceae bacterium]|nr:DUF4339 domain-containing protein [Muribaculaceae bacterium]